MKLNDWEKPENYGYTLNHNQYFWAWEFIRRSPIYQANYKAIVGQSIKEPGYLYPAVVTATPDSPEFALHPDNDGLKEQWKMRYWLNPSNHNPTYLEFTSEALPPPILIYEKDYIA